MKLYSAPGSGSSAAHICLVEEDIPFDLVKVDLRGDRRLPDGRFLKDLNPKNAVPVLELDNGQVLTENAAILQFIADFKPSAGLAPASNTFARVRLQEALSFVGTELHPTLGAFFDPRWPQEARAVLLERFAERASYLDGVLQESDYLVGDRFSVADAYLYVVLSWCPMLEININRYLNLVAFQERVGDRPSVKLVRHA
ncbi:glutathione S-transferase [Marinobacterium nitratireducens]|uniref:Glutathione S-transferase n=1 Tax=Marinobacterium nitratireducens TaxID=518897 RepID=A0A917Z705_9GAMM|nr:glutathione binding-like protein [Marinobacterium nitratireducens]GGO77013.1 glutathione S-transferase [Marinobacterium nitratireducens]